VDIIRIGERKDRDYDEWIIEANRLLGFPDDVWVYSGNAPYEFAWIGKALYKRCREDVFFRMEVNQGSDDPPHVMCQCGSFEFTLRYGGYELRATCTQCGKKETVYDG